MSAYVQYNFQLFERKKSAIKFNHCYGKIDRVLSPYVGKAAVDLRLPEKAGHPLAGHQMAVFSGAAHEAAAGDRPGVGHSPENIPVPAV
jgi:hypothetical protein